MKKKIFMLLMTMVFMLTACGEAETAQTKETAKEVVEEAKEAAEEAEDAVEQAEDTTEEAEDALKEAEAATEEDEKTEAEVEVPEQQEEPAAAPAPAPALPTVSVIRCSAGTVLQPVKGTVIPREEIPDETFATGVLGDGVGIQPEEGLVVAPFDGTISSVVDSQHAVGIDSNGMELLIHVGVNTVSMNGDGFTCFVKEGEEVKAGQPLIRFDIDKIRAAGHSDTVVVLVTNSYDFEDIECGAKE